MHFKQDAGAKIYLSEKYILGLGAFKAFMQVVSSKIRV